SRDLLLSATDIPEAAEAIKGMDMTVFTSADILEAANIISRGREREINSGLFVKGMLRKFAKEKRKLFLIADDEESLSQLKEELLSANDALKIVGAIFAEQEGMSEEKLINEINSVIPDAVMIKQKGVAAEVFINRSFKKVNSKLLISLGTVGLKDTENHQSLKDIIIGKLFRRQANKFEQQI
ncbi:MAG: hypothetical protein K6F99_10915, partial [Lachnospiraceae bacterium]|nr:hypothetical protein [Lachnospiraceae bacterium]